MVKLGTLFQILNLQSKLDFMQDNTTDKSNVLRLDNKVRDLETKLDFEKNSSRRLEVGYHSIILDGRFIEIDIKFSDRKRFDIYRDHHNHRM